MRLIPVGRVIAAHGVKGEVKFRYYNETATASPQYPSFFVEGAGTDVELKPSRVRQQGNVFIIKFKGLETVEEVSFLLKKELAVAERDLPAPDEDEYYDYQLVGLDVTNEEGRIVGKVTGVMHVRGRDILEMEYRTTGGTREALLLMTDDHIIRISTEEEGFVQVREGSLAE